MTGHVAEIHTNHHSRHYESCLQSNCSRSPSPARKLLWEPKHPPSQKLSENKKAHPVRLLDIAKSRGARDESPFVHRNCGGNYSTPNFLNRDPLFTYTINEGPVNKGNVKSVEVTIQQHPSSSFPPSSKLPKPPVEVTIQQQQHNSSSSAPQSSRSKTPVEVTIQQHSSSPSSRSKTPEPHRPQYSNPKELSAGNLTVDLDWERSAQAPPIISIKNYKTRAPDHSSCSPRTVHSASSPVSTKNCGLSCPGVCPSPTAIGALDSLCKAFPCLCCSPRQAVESCNSVQCQLQPCPYRSRTPGSREDCKAASPSNPSCSPQDLVCQPRCPVPCPFLSSNSSSPRAKEDTTTPPIKPCSCSLQNLGSFRDLPACSCQPSSCRSPRDLGFHDLASQSCPPCSPQNSGPLRDPACQPSTCRSPQNSGSLRDLACQSCSYRSAQDSGPFRGPACQPCSCRSLQDSGSLRDRACQPCSCRSPQDSGLRDQACQPCSCPKILSTSEDKATSPAKPCCSPQDSRLRELACLPCSCPLLGTSRIRPPSEDKATSPTQPRSRSVNPVAEVHIHTPLHSRSDSFCSDGSIEIKTDDGDSVKVEWDGDVGPLKVELPIAFQREAPKSLTSDDQIHSHIPQLEAFYTSSCNRSQSPSPTPRWCLRQPASAAAVSQGRSVSPSPPRSDRPSRWSRGTPRPEWNPCRHLDDFCPSLKHSASSSPWRSSAPSRSRSRSPPTKTPSAAKGLSRDSSLSSLHIHGRDGQIRLNWEYPKSDSGSHSTSGTPRRFECTSEGSGGTRSSRSLSPVLTLTPRGPGNGQVKIAWSSNSPSDTDSEDPAGPSTNCGRPPRCHLEEYEEPDSPPSPSDRCDHVFGGEFESDEAPPSQMPRPAALITHSASPQTTPASAKSYGEQTRPTPRPPARPIVLHRDPSSQSASASSKCCDSQCVPCVPCPAPVLNCCYDCCCCREECKVVEGINKCPALPPHLQSDWSASLRCPPSQSRTKPVLYRDPDGHQHVMFADGTIEHLSASCDYEPPPPPPQQRPPPCKALLDQESGRFEEYCDHFCPRCGDIVIRAHQRIPCTAGPGKDDGQVAFFTCSGHLDLRDGDSIVRLGRFNSSGKWCASEVVEMFMRGGQGRWMFLGTHEGHECLHPLEADQHQTVRAPNKQLELKLGDLLIHTVPGPNSFYFWNPAIKFEDCEHSHLLLRAYIGRPRVVDENHNLACCVAGHLPVGYAELYVKVNRSWLFLGRDDHMFTEHELVHFS